ncbi:TPA: hypothetical protein ACH3X2_000365 [Trebouxia sp. C0005]
MKTNLLTWALFCVCWEQAVSATVTCDSTCYGAQIAALAETYTSTNGSGWSRPGDWATMPTLSTTDISAACTILSESLTGLCCDYTQSDCDYSTGSYGVIALVLAGQSLQGTLPTSLLTALAPTLVTFIISGNQLTGTLPDLAQLSLATSVLLAKNKFTGTIPAAVLELPSAVRIDLGGNMLTGTVPIVSTGVNLSLLYLDHNRLTGSFPLLYTATEWHVFELSSNEISGPLAVPSYASTADSTEYTTRYLGLDASFGYALNLLFGDNQLTGTLPAWLASLPLTTIDASNNSLSGALPATVLEGIWLQSLDYSANNLTGSIASNVTSFSLESMSLSVNSLTGSLPEAISNMTLLKTLNLAYNTLEGALPATLGDLESLDTLNIEASGMTSGSSQNALKQYLPSWLQFDTTVSQIGQQIKDPNMLCDVIIPAAGSVVPLTQIAINPAYYRYQTCTCASGYDEHWVNSTYLKCVTHVVPVLSQERTWYQIVLPMLLAMFTIVCLSFLWTQYSNPGIRKLAGVKQLLRNAADEMTLVLTDVEGTQALSQWNPGALSTAMTVHHEVLRAQLNKYKGVEMQSDGDAVLLGFRDPVSAIAWCLATQQALLGANWPNQLQKHKLTRTATLAGLTKSTANSQPAPGQENVPNNGESESAEVPVKPVIKKKRLIWDIQIDPDDADMAGASEEAIKMMTQSRREDPERIIIFRGLRVRMCVVTGVPDPSASALAKPVDKYPALLPVLKAMATIAQGGQVLCASSTYTLINSRLTDIARRVPEQPNAPYNSMQSALHGMDQAPKDAGLVAQASFDSLNGDSDDDAFSEVTGISRRSMSGWGSFAGLQGAERNVSRFFRRFIPSHTTAQTGSEPDNTREGVMVMDMGLHAIPTLVEPQQIIQVLIPGVEERARHLPPLMSSSRLMPGYFDAPGASEAALMVATGQKDTFGNVVMVFCNIDGFKEMREANQAMAEVALNLYRECLRKVLMQRGGYECQETEGSFMLSFYSCIDAVQFCILAQHALLAVPWPGSVLALPKCRTILGTDRRILFQGPHVKMGVYRGRPTGVSPHVTTGRADYFGPFVNRTARFCNAGAHGGQICVSWEVVEQMLKDWGQMTGAIEPNLVAMAPIAVTANYMQSVLSRQKAILDAITLRATWSNLSSLSSATFWSNGGSTDVNDMSSKLLHGLSQMDADTLTSLSSGVSVPALSPSEAPTSPTLLKTFSSKLLRSMRRSIEAKEPLSTQMSNLSPNRQHVETAGTAPPPPIKGDSVSLLSSPSKRGFFFGGTLVKANSDPVPDSPSANSESPLLNSRFSLSRVSEDRAMLSREATASGALPDIEKPDDREYVGDDVGLHDFVRPERENGRMSFASVGESLRGAVGHGARAVARLGRSHNTLLRTLPIIDQGAVRESLHGDKLKRKQRELRSFAEGAASLHVLNQLDTTVDQFLQDEWRSISQLEIHHRGQYNFKGLTEEQSVWQVNSSLLANRRFPAGVSSTAKGQMVEPGQGLAYIINFTDNTTESSKPEPGAGLVDERLTTTQ